MRGKIAYCGHGHLGLILSDRPRSVMYKNGEEGQAWTGIHLTNGEDHKIGDMWSSRAPKVISHISIFVNDLEKWLKRG